MRSDLPSRGLGMLVTALTILVGDRVRFLGLIFGLAFSTLLVVQQGAIFRGIMSITYSFVTDTPNPQIWIDDPGVVGLEITNPLLEKDIDVVRSVPGVAWAVPMTWQLGALRRENGSITICRLTGIDDATFIGAPLASRMVAGSVADLRRPWTCLVDARAASGKLRREGRPLRVGDQVQIKDRVIDVVGIYAAEMDILLTPNLYMRRSQSTQLFGDAGYLNHILAGVDPGRDPQRVCADIRAATGLAARTPSGVNREIHDFFMYETGIPANFAIAVLIGIIIGAAIVGQTFWQYVNDHRRIFATLKAMGMGGGDIGAILVVQALVVAVVGWGLGLGGAALMGAAIDGSDLAFRLEPWLLAASLGLMLAISLSAPLITIRGILRIDPATVFRS